MLLTKLDLSSNNITTLEHIRPLTALPNLQTLSLRANPLTSLSTSPNNSLIFPNLNHLDLTSTLLPILSSLNPIPTSFPALTSLLTTQTPLTAYPSASLHTIARLATLTSLNYSRITPPERQNAELYYLSQISKQLASTTDDSEDSRAAILSQHPRWNQLCTIHGEPTTTTSRKAAATAESLPGTLAARVTTFTFCINNTDLKKAQTHAQTIAGHHHHPVASSNEPHDPATTTEKTKLLPTTISTTRLIGIAARLFSLRPASIKLIWESQEWDPFVPEDGNGGEGAGWSVSEDEDDDDDDGQEGKKQQKKKKEEEEEIERGQEAQKWKRREVELVHGTREVGFFVDGGKSQEARVRLELR